MHQKLTEKWGKCGLHCNKIQEDDSGKEGVKNDILKHIILTINFDDCPGDDEFVW